MQVHKLIQGSPEWLAFRAQHHGSSEAAAMLGLSKTTTRTELLHVKHTGLGKEFSDYVQKNVLDYGHEVEALTRPLIVKLIGEQLYPVTCSEGKLSASCDGLTIADDIAWENKQPNERICALVAAGQVPEEHMPQCQQVLMVTGAEKLIFSVSDGTPENLLTVEVLPDPAWFERLRAGWAQFDLDLAAYTPPAAAPVVVAEPVQALPAVSVRVDGTISVVDNFDVFEEAVRNFIEHRLIRAPQTDQDFADLDTQIKAMKGAREAIKAGKAQMLAQIEPVDAANKRADMLDKLLQTNQAMAEKLLASEKENRRTEIVTKAAAALREYIATLNRELGAPYIPMPQVDFAGAIKGMRSLSSMEDAVATRLANAKIDANAVAATVRANLKTLDALGAEFALLFADKNQLVLKAEDDFKAIATNRVDAHKAEVLRKEEATRERIRAEEQAKAEREAREKLLAEQEAERKAAEAAKAAEAPTAAPAPAPALAAAAPTGTAPDPAMVQVHAVVRQAMPPAQASAAAPARTAAPDTPPTLTLGQIGTRLGFNLTAAFLSSLGFEGEKVKGAVLFHEHQFTDICDALDEHIVGVRAKYRVAEAA